MAAIFITGGSGYVGAPLLKRLAGEGEGVKVWAPSRTDLDLGIDDWRAMTPPFPIDVIVHAAASRERSDPGAHRYPEEVRINVDATARLYDWGRRNGVRAIVHVSTISVLEPSSDLAVRINEDAPLDLPPHPYALTKRWGEELAAALEPDFESIAIVRPGMIYGPHPSERMTITKMIAAAKGTTNDGSSSSTGGSTPVPPRPIPAPRGNVFAPVHVDDVVDVLARLALAPREVVVNVVGPDAVFELDMLRDLATHFGNETPSFVLDEDAEAVAFAPSTERVDALFPSRVRTPWREGIARSFPR